MQKIIAKRFMTDEECSSLQGKFLDENAYDTLIQSDADCWSEQGELLFRFRKNAVPYELVKLGYDSLKYHIRLTEARGTASGESFKRIRADGTKTNTTVGNHVETGAAGYMDRNAMVRYCRKTALTHDYFKEFQESVPFIKKIDELYKELCFEYWEKQMNIAKGTNQNYVITGTSFTTVTVNRNFQTAVHKDSGDFPRGFGNLCVYREGDQWSGSYFCLPEFRIAIDMRNTDILFVDVHRWHGNTPFINFNPAPTPYSNAKNNPNKGMYKPGGVDLRFAFVMYYREYMINCKQPSQELMDTKMEQGGFLKL